MPTDTDYSRAAWARITEPKGSAAPWCRYRGGGTERQVALLQDFGAHVLCATPSYALNIAEVAAGMGVDLASGPLRTGVFGAEPWSDAKRHDLEDRLGIAAVDIYGLS